MNFVERGLSRRRLQARKMYIASSQQWFEVVRLLHNAADEWTPVY